MSRSRIGRFAARLCAGLLTIGPGLTRAEDIEPKAEAVAPGEIAEGSTILSEGSCADCNHGYFASTSRRLFESDHCFDDFIQPVSNPVFAKDPRSSTHARFLFINNWTPDTHAVAPDDQIQAYALQLNLAITERLSFIADKDGYAVINRGPLTEGWLNLAAGLKYAFIRRPEDQLIVSGGFMYEVPSGEADVLQGYGAGVLTPFLSGGKGWGDFHTITNMGYSIALNHNSNSEFFYWQQHFDYRLTDWFAPIFEVNWFHYTSGGDHGIPGSVGEGDGLINIGTSDMSGADLATMAFGGRFSLTQGLSTGLAWEVPVSNREDLIDQRIVLDVILRY